MDGDEESLERLVELLPPEARAEFIAVWTKTVSHSGWLPTPDYLDRYNKILPGLAERIVRVPELEQEHRHRLMDKSIERDFTIKRRGQDYALIAMALLLGFSALLAILGDTKAAAMVAVGTLVGIVGIFVSGKIADYKTSAVKDDD